MGKGLGKIPQGFAAVADLFGIKAHVISITKHLLEHQARLFDSASPRQCLHQPEAAYTEGAFTPADAVHRVIIVERIAMDEAVHSQSILDPLHGPDHTRVAGRDEKNQ